MDSTDFVRDRARHHHGVPHVGRDSERQTRDWIHWLAQRNEGERRRGLTHAEVLVITDHADDLIQPGVCELDALAQWRSTREGHSRGGLVQDDNLEPAGLVLWCE